VAVGGDGGGSVIIMLVGLRFCSVCTRMQARSMSELV